MLINKNDPPINEYLREIIDKKPDIAELSLQFKSITDLMPSLHLFEKMPNLKKLSLHGNRIRELPTDLSVFERLQELDVTNNLLDDNMTIISLKTLPRLRSLQYQVKKEKEKRIGEELKSLQYLNNTRIFREKVKKEFEFKNANERVMNDFEDMIMEHFEQLQEYEHKYLGENIEQDASDKFRQDLEQLSRQCLEKLYMDKVRATESVESLMLYKTKFEMYELLKVRGLNLWKFLRSILEEEDKLFKMTSELALSLARAELVSIQKEDEERYKNEFQSQHSIVNKNAIMQKELKRMRKQKDELIGQITQLENNNRKLTDTIMKLSHGEGSKQLTMLQTFQPVPPVSSTLDVPRASQKGRAVEKSVKAVPAIQRSTRIPKESTIHTHYNSGRGLTLKQLKETIDEIYESKVKFDEKNFQGKLGRQTMNQYLFTYLNQKYGLKSLTIEAASNIVSGIQEYSSRDNDVAVFGKILRNQVDEQFRFVQAQLKATINDLLKMHIKTKMPFKSASEINDALNRKTTGQLTYQECQDLVKYLYNKQDAETIIITLEPLFTEPQRPEQPTRRRGGAGIGDAGKSKIDYAIFLQQVLNFQLRNHEKLLRPLVNAFKLKDKDADGIVDEEEFIAIIELLCDDAVDLIPSLLEIVDPYETKKITFTQMVRLVANYPENNPILNRYALQNDNQDIS